MRVAAVQPTECLSRPRHTAVEVTLVPPLGLRTRFPTQPPLSASSSAFDRRPPLPRPTPTSGPAPSPGRPLNRRDRTVDELGGILLGKRVEPGVADEVVTELIELGLPRRRAAMPCASPRTGAASTAGARSGSPGGCVRSHSTAEHIDAALAEQDPEEEKEAALELLRRRCPHPPSTRTGARPRARHPDPPRLLARPRVRRPPAPRGRGRRAGRLLTGSGPIGQDGGRWTTPS